MNPKGLAPRRKGFRRIYEEVEGARNVVAN